jgi:DNA-binding transcriptional MerR regulator
LRMWERRYRFPQPGRDSHGERVYLPEQVEKLRMIKRLMDRGQRPGKLVEHSLEALQDLCQGPGEVQADASCKDLAAELKGKLQNVALCDDWVIQFNKIIKYWETTITQSSQIFAQELDNKLHSTEQKLDMLVDNFLDGIIEKDSYIKKKEELIKNKMLLKEQKQTLGQRGTNWIELLKNWVITGHHAHKLALSNDFIGIKSLVEKIGTNRRLKDKRLELDYLPEWQIVLDRQVNSGLEKFGEIPRSLALLGVCTDTWSLLNEARTIFEKSAVALDQDQS